MPRALPRVTHVSHLAPCLTSPPLLMSTQPAVFQCPVCGQNFGSSRGLNGHRSQAVACSWYTQEPEAYRALLKDMGEVVIADSEPPPPTAAAPPLEQYPSDDNNNNNENPVLFVALDALSNKTGSSAPLPADSPSLSRMLGAKPLILDTAVDLPFTEEYKDAGHVLRIEESLKTQWRRLFEANTGIRDVVREGTTNLNTGKLPPEAFAPFTSELDWQVAQWFIKEDVGHSAFDRFLQIPEVCTLFPFYCFL